MGVMRHILTEMTEKQQHLLSQALRKLGNTGKGNSLWTKEDLKQTIKDTASANGLQENDTDFSATAGALLWRVEQRFDYSPTFSDMQHLDLNEIVKPGQCTIMQLNEIDQRDQQIIVSTLLRRLYTARVDTERGKVSSGESYVPYPVFVLLEEAHHFAPSGADVISSAMLKQVLGEGRKFGIGVGIISQRPGKLDADVLSQCQTQCIMRIVNQLDQQSIAAAVESVGHELLGNLPALSRGQVIIAGAAVNTPILCRVRERITPHGGESKDAPLLWQESYQKQNQTNAKNNLALNGSREFRTLR
jgi:hypothetical protein